MGFFVLNMFVGVVVENFHRCRAEQEKEERARRAAKRAKKIEERRRSKSNPISSFTSILPRYHKCDMVRCGNTALVIEVNQTQPCTSKPSSNAI